MDISTKQLATKKVWTERPRKNDPDATKKVGRIRSFVFHPREPRCVGFLVKRPDVALMFHRKDLFVAFNGFRIQNGDIVLNDDAGSKDRSACKALGINLDDCVIWVGLPVITEDGTTLGIVDGVTYDGDTGRVLSLDISQGATANTLLGQRSIPADDICGFRRGIGAQLYMADDDDTQALGALLVRDSAKDAEVAGGVAEKAGAASVVATDQAKRTVKKVRKVVKAKTDAAKPKVEEAKKAAGEAAEKGVFATGRQIGRAQGMFKGFADEFKKGMNGE